MAKDKEEKNNKNGKKMIGIYFQPALAELAREKNLFI